MKQNTMPQFITPCSDATRGGVKTFYPSASCASSSRYIVSLVVGYDGNLPMPNVLSADADNGGCVDAKEAAEAALDLVRGGGTIWTVYDRETGETTQWEDVGE